jgi:hypothetical protein
VTEKDKDQLVEVIKDSILVYQEFLGSVEKGVEEVLNEVCKVVRDLKRFLKFLRENLRDVISKGRILIPTNFSDAEKEFKRSDITFFHSIFLNQVTIKKALSSLKDLSLLLYHQSNQNEFNILNKSDDLYFTSSKSDSLFYFNKDKETLSNLSFEALSLRRSLASICSINKSQVFIYGGFCGSERFNSAYLLNKETRSFLELPQNIIRSQAGALLFSSKVYVFGGSNLHGNDFTAKSNYFDLEHMAWFSVSDLPYKVRNTSAALFGNFFLISATGNGIFKFDALNENYEEIAKFIVIGSSHVIVKFDEIVFLIVDRVIYFAETKDLDVWHTKNTNIHFSVTSSKPVFSVKNQCFYFADSDEKILKFDPIKLSLKYLEV